MDRFTALLLLTCAFCVPAASGAELAAPVAQAERQRIAAAKSVTPATIAIFDDKAQSGGSGVIIRDDGLAVTNFHVVAPCGSFMLCGLPDGDVVDAVILGVDPTGDVALIRLLKRRSYPVAKIGDSSRASVGQEVLVVGNPLLLADNLRPTVTHGILSGVGRYQYPSGTILEYANCLQTDAAINPGNSGGPLYNLNAELIGINGRASFEKRGRVNVGVGYAISVDQVMRFVPMLEGGRVVDHAKLGFTTRTLSAGRVVVDQVEPSADAYRRGVRYGDEVVRVAGSPVSSANQLLNLVATYPPGWRLKVELHRGAQTRSVAVRLEPSHAPGELEAAISKQMAPTKPQATPYAEVHSRRPGFSNYIANRHLRDRVLEHCPQRSGEAGTQAWRLTGSDAQQRPVKMQVGSERASYVSHHGEYWIDPNRPLAPQLDPPGSGGLLAGLSLWRTLLAQGADGFQELYYWGRRPWPTEGPVRECLVANQGAVRAEFFFDTESGDLVGVEYTPDPAEDSCRIEFGHKASEAAAVDTVTVVRGDEIWTRLSAVQLTRTAKQP